MTQPPVKARNPVAAHPITSAAIAILIIASIFFTLYVPLYARTTPKVGPFPFFYFYLLAYMPVVAIALGIVIALQNRLKGGASSDGPAAASTSPGEAIK